MAIFDPFDLVVVPFPFTDRQQSKRRPALVLSAGDFQKDSGHVILAMVTSAKRSSWKSDFALADWNEAGLPHPSVVRAKLFTLDARFLIRKLGTLSARDQKRCRLALSEVLIGLQNERE